MKISRKRKDYKKIAKTVCDKYEIEKSIKDELNISDPPPRKRKRISHVLHDKYIYGSGGQSVDPISGVHDEGGRAKGVLNTFSRMCILHYNECVLI